MQYHAKQSITCKELSFCVTHLVSPSSAPIKKLPLILTGGMSSRLYKFRLKGSDKRQEIELVDGDNLKIARQKIARELSIDESLDELVFIVSGQILNDKSKFSELSKSQLPDDGFILVVQKPVPDLRTPRSLRGRSSRAAAEEEAKESLCESNDVPPEGLLRDTMKHVPTNNIDSAGGYQQKGANEPDEGLASNNNDSGAGDEQKGADEPDEGLSSNNNDSGAGDEQKGADEPDEGLSSNNNDSGAGDEQKGADEPDEGLSSNKTDSGARDQDDGDNDSSNGSDASASDDSSEASTSDDSSDASASDDSSSDDDSANSSSSRSSSSASGASSSDSEQEEDSD